MSRRKQQRRGLTGSQILEQDVFGRRVQGGSTVDVPTSTWIPLSDGAEPPSIVSDGAGNFVLVAYPL